MLTDIRQSPFFSQFMQDLGWETKIIKGNYAFLRRFPAVGYFAKIPRTKNYIERDVIHKFIKENKIFRLKISPFINTDNKDYFSSQKKMLSDSWQIDKSPFNPTTTIYIDLTKKEEDIFYSFDPTKRRAIRKAIKNGIVAKESNNIEEFVPIRKNQYFPLGFLMENETRKIWKNFSPDNASLLLAYINSPKTENQAVSGILLLYFEKIAYYWFASSLKIGKKLFAPTLLVWEALKFAKKRGCRVFDFEGIYDERFPKAAESWKGFTKFKEGFGGQQIVLLENFYR